MRTVLCVTIVALLVSRAMANPAPLGGPGAGPVPLTKSANVTLKSATVIITDGVKLTYPSPAMGGGKLPLHAVRYDGTYVLKNLGKGPQKVRVGFPTAIATINAGTDEGGVRSFKVRVDGKSIKPKVVRQTIKGTVFFRDKLSPPVVAALLSRGLAEALVGDPTLVDLARLGRKPKTIAARLKKITLSKKQKKALTKKLIAHYTDPSDFEIESVEQRWYTFEVQLGPSRSAKVRIRYDSPRGDANIVASSDYSFAYTMRTGARWSGPIDRYRLVLRLKTRRPVTDYEIRPRGYKKVKPRELVYDFRKFVPREDLLVKVKHRRQRHPE